MYLAQHFLEGIQRQKIFMVSLPMSKNTGSILWLTDCNNNGVIYNYVDKILIKVDHNTAGGATATKE